MALTHMKNMHEMLEDAYLGVPTAYTLEELSGYSDIFRDRTSLFFTPTENMPPQYVGEGRLDVVLPLASPTAYEYGTNPAFRVPRLWVDLLQRATGKLRWTPMSPAKITIVRYDTSGYDLWSVMTGAKALIDALIVKAAGRGDGRILHYFGAIQDDNMKVYTHGGFYQEIVGTHAEARTRIVVEPAPDENEERPGISLYAPGQNLPENIIDANIP